MRSVRFSIAGSMGVVPVVAIGPGALQNPTPIWAGATLLVTFAAPGLAIIGAISPSSVSDRAGVSPSIPIFRLAVRLTIRAVRPSRGASASGSLRWPIPSRAAARSP